MKLSMPEEELKRYMRDQLSVFFPDRSAMVGNDVDLAFRRGLERLENCFRHLSFPAYCGDDGQTYFSHLHADQYAQFLYYFSNSLWQISQNKAVCDKLMYLNRILNNFFFSYKGSLPDIFFLGHPVGAVLGNAVYSDYLVVFQNVTVNTSTDQNGSPAPVLGKGLFLAAGAKIIGSRRVGDRVSIGVDAVVYEQEVPDDKVVVKNDCGGIKIADRKKPCCMAQNYFRTVIR